MSTEPLQTHFSEGDIKVDVKRLPGCLVEFTITTGPETSHKAYTKATKEIRKEVSLPGFRRGKVPEATISQKFGKQIESEWKKVLLNDSINKAINLTKIYPAYDNEDQPRIKKLDANSYAKDGESSFHVIFETLPEIPTIDLHKLTAPHVTKREVDQTELDDRLMELRLNKATWEELNEKTIEDRDFIELLTKPVDEEDEDAEPARIWVRKDRLPEHLYKKLIGLRAGDSFIDDSSPSEDDGMPKKLNVTVKAVLKPTMPEVDDELAKQFGAKSVEELTTNIEKSAHNEAERQYQEESSNILIKQLLDTLPVEVPESLLAKHTAIVGRQVERNLEQSSPNSSDIERKNAVKQLHEMIQKRAREILHLRFIIHAIAKEHKIGVSDAEFRHEMEELARLIQHGLHPLIRVGDDVQELQGEVYHQLLTQKALKFILNNIEKKH